MSLQIPSDLGDITQEIGKYLVITTGSDGDGDEPKSLVVSDSELGADQDVLSESESVGTYSCASSGSSFPNLVSQFGSRFNTGIDPDGMNGAAPIFQGIDWSGSIALTLDTGSVASFSNSIIYGPGVFGEGSVAIGATSNDCYFPEPQQNPANEGTTPLDDVSTAGGNPNQNLSALSAELSAVKSYIDSLPADITYTDNGQAPCKIESGYAATNGNGGYRETFVEGATNGNPDGIVVVDLDCDGSDIDMQGDWVVNSEDGKLVIFRLVGPQSLKISNGSITCDEEMDVSDGELCAVFYSGDESSGNSDTIFDFSNTVFGGIGFWDLNNLTSSDKTNVSVDNSQGCVQYISKYVNFQNVRYNRCSLTPADPEFSVVKTAELIDDGDDDGVIELGDTLRYIIEIQNTGAVDLTTVTVQDTLPQGVTYVPDSTFQTLSLPPDPGDDDQVPDNGGAFPLAGAGAAITFTPAIGQGESGYVYFDVEIDTEIDFSFQILSVSKSGTAAALPGETATYELSAVNNFGFPVQDVKIVDVIPAGLDIDTVTPDPVSGDCTVSGQEVSCLFAGELAPNGSVSVTIDTTVQASPPNQAENTACVSFGMENTAAAAVGGVTEYGQVSSDVETSCDTFTTSLPVTLGYFLAQPAGDNVVSIRWQTATETGNAGFNLYADGPDGLVRLNQALIPSTVVDSVEPADYEVTVESAATGFYLEDVSVDGASTLAGPFQLGVPAGSRIDADPVAPGHRVYLPYLLRR